MNRLPFMLWVWDDENNLFTNANLPGYFWVMREDRSKISYDEISSLPAFAGDTPRIFAMRFANPYPSLESTALAVLSADNIDTIYWNFDNPDTRGLLIAYRTPSGKDALAYISYELEYTDVYYFNPAAIEAGLFYEWFNQGDGIGAGNSIEEIWQNATGHAPGEESS